MCRRLFHGLFFSILFLSLSSRSIALIRARASEAGQSDSIKSDLWSFPELLNLVNEFRRFI